MRQATRQAWWPTASGQPFSLQRGRPVQDPTATRLLLLATATTFAALDSSSFLPVGRPCGRYRILSSKTGGALLASFSVALKDFGSGSLPSGYETWHTHVWVCAVTQNQRSEWPRDGTPEQRLRTAVLAHQKNSQQRRCGSQTTCM